MLFIWILIYCVHCSFGSPVLYVSGALFTQAQRDTQVTFANIGRYLGYEVYLPQEDGLEFAGLSTLPGINVSQLVNAIFLVDVSQLLRAHTILVNCNGVEPDSGSIVEASIGYLLRRNIILFRDDVRSFIDNLPLNPMLLGLRSTPPMLANTTAQVYTFLNQAIRNELHPVIPFDPPIILAQGNYLLRHKDDPNIVSIINNLPY